MTVNVLIPFRSRSDDRNGIWMWMKERWLQTMPECELIIRSDGGQPSDPFNEGRAWNQAAAHATGEILVLGESEVAFNRRDIVAAIETVQRERCWMVAEAYYQLTAAKTAEILSTWRPAREIRDIKPNEFERVFSTSVSSPVILPREAFEAVGGYDERYEGWGHIDKAMAAALTTLWGSLRRFPGAVYHLHHERARFRGDCNRDLTARYLAAEGNRDAMRALIDERDRIAA